MVWPLIALIIRVVVPIVIDAVKGVQEVRHEEEEEQRRHDRHPLEVEALQLENLKTRVEVAQLIDALDPALRELLGLEPDRDLPNVNMERLEALKNQAVEAATEIALEATGLVELRQVGDALGDG